jgi:plastocyanin
MRKFLVAASLAAVAALSVPAHAAVNTVVAGPGSFVAGFATTQVYVVKGQTVTFANADIDTHDVRSTTVDANNNPLFKSALIGTGTTEITGIDKLTVGRTYDFVCSRHGNMKGKLTVQA